MVCKQGFGTLALLMLMTTALMGIAALEHMLIYALSLEHARYCHEQDIYVVRGMAVVGTAWLSQHTGTLPMHLEVVHVDHPRGSGYTATIDLHVDHDDRILSVNLYKDTLNLHTASYRAHQKETGGEWSIS